MLLSCDTMRVSLRCTVYGHYQHSKYNKKLTSYKTPKKYEIQKSIKILSKTKKGWEKTTGNVYVLKLK